MNQGISLNVCRDADQLAIDAAEHILAAAAAAIRDRGRFTLALSGGSTPEKTYTLLAQPERSARLDWARTLLFFGDERVVPADDARSNYHLARRSLLDRVAVPADHVFPIPTDRATPADCAAAYAATLARAFGLPPDGVPPRFDLILLGLGDDGHTASLFPGAAALKEERAWVTWGPPGTLPPPVDRVTFTYPTLNAARQVLFLVAGANKAEPVRDVLEGQAPRERRPAAGVRPAEGIVTWLLDEVAARLLAAASRERQRPE
jgi:6-phosphogluconolactonase